MPVQTEKKIVVWHLLSNSWNSAITEYAISTIRSFELLEAENILTVKENSVAYTRAKKETIKTTTVSSFDLRKIFQLRSLLKKINPNFIFLYGGKETFLARFFFFEKISLVRLRGYALRRGVFDFLFPLAHSHLDFILSPGKELRDKMQSKLLSKKVCFLPLGCDHEIFKVEPKVWKSFSYEKKHLRPRILILGRLDPVKGHREFLRFFSKLLDRWPFQELNRPYLVILGKEENLKVTDIKEFINNETSLKLGQDVILKTNILEKKDLSSLLQETALGVIPSLWSEEICRVAQEFLLCGTPVCVSGVGSLNDVLFPGAGWNYQSLAEEDLLRCFADWLKKSALESQEDRIKRGLKAKDLFSFETMSKNLKKLLNF